MDDFTLPTPPSVISLNDELTLVQRVRSGDQGACTRLVTLFSQQMMTVARRFMRCDDDCDDVVQDAFIRAFNGLAHYKGDARLSTWLHRITVNSCLMKLRINASRKETNVDELLPAFGQRGWHERSPTAMNDPWTQVEMNETRSAIHDAIDKLPHADRAVLILRDIEEMGTAATAARLETSEHNVKRRLRRARQTLCDRLKPMMAEETHLSLVV